MLLTIRLLSLFSWQGVTVCAFVYLKRVGEILIHLRGVVDDAVRHLNVLVQVDFREEGVSFESLVHPRDEHFGCFIKKETILRRYNILI
jgi:hypothetical protein